MNLKKYSWLAALPLLFTACQDDMLVEKHSQQEIYTLTATMDGGANSRAQIVLNGTNTTKESFHWNEGDAFTLFQVPVQVEPGVYNGEITSHEFFISDAYSDNNPAATADFTTENPLTVGRKFKAFYPSPVMDEGVDNEFHLTLNNTLKDNTDESWIKYFKENMFMVADGSITETMGVSGLTFNHLCGIIRVTYHNESKEDRNISSIYVNGSWGTSYGYQLNDGGSIWESYGEGVHGISFQEGATVLAGQSKNFYILFMDSREPEENKLPLSNVRVLYSDKTEKRTSEYSKELPLFKPGKCYWLNITDNGNNLFWTNDSSGGDEEPELDFHDAEVEDLQGLYDALAVNARTTIINFLNDITLTNPLTINNEVNFYMNGHNITLASDYRSEDMDAVFDVSGRLYVKHGNLVGKDGDKLHNYYFKLSGENADLSLRGVELKTGTAIANAIFMDDDNLMMREQWISDTEIKNCSIETSGNAIHWNAAKKSPQLWSDINGNITGNVLIETTFDELNTYMMFQTGTINGSLICNVPSGLPVSEYIVRSWENVTIGSSYEQSWNQAGRYVKDLDVIVTNESELRQAVETAQVAKESTFIHLSNDITLTSPLTIVKPVDLYLLGNTLSLSSTFNWDSSESAILVTTDETTGKVGNLSIYGKNDWGESTNIGTLQGATTETGKYLIKNTVGDMWLHNITLSAKNKMNAICIENSSLIIDGNYSTNINVAEGCYALNMIAQSQPTRVHLQSNINIVGNVGLTHNYSGDDYCMLSYYNDGVSSITGDLIKTGTYKDNFRLNLENINLEGTGWYPEVSSLKEIEEAARKGNSTLVLTAPLTITDADSEEDYVGVNLYGTTLLLSDSFDWSNTDAVITLSGTKEKMIDNGIIQCSTTTTGKYLVYSTSDFFTGGLTLIAKDQMNAVYVEDARLHMSRSTVEAEGGYSLDIKASTTSCASAVVDNNSTVKGKVRFENNYPVMPGGDEEPSHLAVLEGLIKGNLTLTGTNTQGMEVIVREGGSIVGKGWPEMDGVSVPTGNATNSGTSGNNFGDGGEF